jgi:NAD(P)-dependent dehydrogenase (short-subunit alcohol dehydrogenase family)
MTEKLKYIVLGASGGIGSATCRRLREAGADLVLAGRNEETLAQLSEELGAPYHLVDATNFEQVDKLLGDHTDEAEPLSGVVNCVGSLLLKPAHITTTSEWSETIALNLTSAFATVHAAAKAMRKGGGSIVLMSSAAAQIGLPNHEAIAAAKAGVIGLTLSAAASYAARGIRVNAVAPGLVKTPMTEKIWSTPKSAEASRQLHALGRLGEPDDIASLICWLLAPANSWITGQIIGADGGLGSLRSTVRP